ncbi:hypothetical protein JYU04_01655 [Dehalococcoides mccartyi]|nr:hypothetical protein [Dehalococcoides mccartyi]
MTKLFITLIIFALIAMGGCTQSTSDTSSTPTPVIQLDYDDSWVNDIPDSIGEFAVVFIETPKNKACLPTPVIILRHDQPTIEGYLQEANQNIIEDVRSIENIPHDILISFIGPNSSYEQAAANRESWNERRLKSGCITLSGGGGE